ncbi:hypothetical protein GCM10017714_24430 [Curtobacterium pusillum]|uniref:Uncharacterized protein n=1 Tax=Curtobacterium pusillum TaxID=69373 RepID=A0ABX2MAF0_9MICO|nr:hypothetical protein [Curtobacterium pusillum]NUU15012.1 hypothetical protein [Curtobacterium pusillum]GLK32574.1 hypothetical protein GCM10017610_28590 [Curtobacterium pusillum]
MTNTSTPAIARTAAVSTATIAALGSTILAVDNTLGFAGFHLLGSGVAPFIVAVVMLAAVVCAGLAVRTDDLARGIAAAAVVGFALAQSPALALTLWFPLSTALQALVPLGFAACAIITWRSSEGQLRILPAIAAILAVAWAIGAFVPLWLEVFLSLQATTMLTVTVLVASPFLSGIARYVRTLWDSAAIR